MPACVLALPCGRNVATKEACSVSVRMKQVEELWVGSRLVLFLPHHSASFKPIDSLHHPLLLVYDASVAVMLWILPLSTFLIHLLQGLPFAYLLFNKGIEVMSVSPEACLRDGRCFNAVILCFLPSFHFYPSLLCTMCILGALVLDSSKS